jgi:ketopantoate reductase
VSVCLASYEQLSEHHRSAHREARIPNNWYQSIWFKVVFDFCSKMKVVKIVF